MISFHYMDEEIEAKNLGDTPRKVMYSIGSQPESPGEESLDRKQRTF